MTAWENHNSGAKPVQVAVWDFNGVIVDDVNAHRIAFNSILAMFDLPMIETIDKCSA